MTDIRQEASALIVEKLFQAKELIRECELLADRHDIVFNWDISYGMGGYYDGSEGEWMPSSESC